MYQEPTPIQKTENFFKIIEGGDIALFDIFPESVAMFGYTKVGKTSSCHIACDSPLNVEDIRGELMFKPTSKKYSTAKIGFTTESETEIPNTFETLLKEKDPKDGKYKFVKEGTTNKKIWLLDQPGYGDTYGFHRIFSNGYFHYRTFSKTPKLKFILAVSRNDLTGTAQKFKKTISYFINTFNDWEKVKNDIMKATSLLITKADVKTNYENLKSIIKSLRDSVGNMGTNERAHYQGLIDELLDNNKMYFIEKPKDIHSKTLDSNILHQIYANSTFWVRPINKNVVDMSDINFSVSGQILKELRDKKKESFRQDFTTFMDLMDKRKMDIIVSHEASLVNIVKILQQDAVGGNQRRQFLGQMENFVKDFYTFSQQFNKERELLEVNLFKTPEAQKWNQISNEDLQKENKNAYFIKKFKVLEFLCTLNEQNQLGGQISRTVSELENFSTMFQAIFKRFSILRSNPRDKVIYRYSYIIQRIIEQSKILTLILFTDDSVKEQIVKLDLKVFSEDIFRTISDRFFSTGLGQIDLVKSKKQFIRNVDITSLISTINPQIINFFESIPTKDDEQTKYKIAQMIIEYSRSIYKNDRRPPESEKTFAVVKLFKYRNDFYSYLAVLTEQDGSRSSKENVTEIIFCLSKSLADILRTFNLWQDSRQCYRSINNATMVSEIYQQQLKTLSLDPQAQRKLYLSYSKQARKYQRRELAIGCAQKAYSLSNKYNQLVEASSLLETLSTERQALDIDEENEQLQYLKSLVQKQYCLPLSKELKDSIEISFPIQE